jgi:hypothetical protein
MTWPPLGVTASLIVATCQVRINMYEYIYCSEIFSQKPIF